MSAILASRAFDPAPAAHGGDDDAVDFLSFDDRELEQALKAVSWNPRDVSHYLRTARATVARTALRAGN
jgi:hypothetical protein